MYLLTLLLLSFLDKPLSSPGKIRLGDVSPHLLRLHRPQTRGITSVEKRQLQRHD